MDFSSWVERNREKLGSEYEILFATHVLPLVESLQCDSVTAQHPFVESDGKKRYCDFTIIESEVIRVAIEIDGYDKRGTGTGMSHEDFIDWQRRQASLASLGWHVLRFANRDIRDEPYRCAEYISSLLNRLRQAQVGRVEIVTIQSKPPEVIMPLTKVDDARPPEVLRKKNYKLLLSVALSLLVVFSLWQKNSDKPVDKALPLAVAAQSISSDSTSNGYASAEVPPAHVPSERAFAPVDVSVPVAPVYNDAGVTEPSYGTLDCRNPLDWSAAKEHIGQVVTVVGPLLATKPRPDVTGSPMWLDVGGRYPNQNRLTVVVWGKNWTKFDSRELDSEYWHYIADGMSYASICITGKVAEYKGVPQIELQDPSQLQIGLPRNNH